MAQTTNQERLSALEVHREVAAEDIAQLRTTVARIDTNVQNIKDQLSRQKGFLAGIMFVITPIWAIIVVYARHLWEKLTPP